MVELINIFVIGFIGILFIIAKAWYLFYRNIIVAKLPNILSRLKKYKILGQDTFFVMEPQQEAMNYPCMKYKFATNHPNAYQYIVDVLRPTIDDPSSKFRIQVSQDSKHYFYTNTPTNQIIKYTFAKVDDIDHVNKTILAYQAALNPNKLKLTIANNGFIITVSHLAHNTVSGVFNKIVCPIFHIPQIKLPDYKYIPLYNEAIIINSAIRSLLHLSSTFKLKRYIKDTIPWDSGFNDSTIIKTTLDLAMVKNVKQQLKQNNINIPFPMVFSAIQTLGLLYSSNLKKLTIGTIIGFKSTARINNFTSLPCFMERPMQITAKTFSQVLSIMLLNLYQQLQRSSHLVPSLYSITNIYNINTYLNDNLDVLFSGIPMITTGSAQEISSKLTTDKVQMDGIDISNMYITLPCHSAPVYISFISDLCNVYTTQHIRTREINIAKLKQFNQQLHVWLQGFELVV